MYSQLYLQYALKTVYIDTAPISLDQGPIGMGRNFAYARRVKEISTPTSITIYTTAVQIYYNSQCVIELKLYIYF